MHAKEWVTSHGVALNVTNDLATFRYTVPCGIDGVEMSTVASECARASLPAPVIMDIGAAITHKLAEQFGLHGTPLPPSLRAQISE